MATCTTMFDMISEYVAVVLPPKDGNDDVLALGPEMILQDGLDGRRSKHFTSTAAFKVQGKAVVQILAYDYTSPVQLAQALNPAGSVHPLRLEIIGCPWTDETIINGLPKIFGVAQLDTVCIHNCLNFDLPWVAKSADRFIRAAPFKLDPDFSVPRRLKFGHKDVGVAAWRDVVEQLAVFNLVHEHGSKRPGESLFLTQETMFKHIVFFSNKNYSALKVYNARDLPRALGPELRQIYFHENEIRPALEHGGKALHDLTLKTAQVYHKTVRNIKDESVLRHPMLLLTECYKCETADDTEQSTQFIEGGINHSDDEDSDEDSSAQHLGLFFSTPAASKPLRLKCPTASAAISLLRPRRAHSTSTMFIAVCGTKIFLTSRAMRL